MSTSNAPRFSFEFLIADLYFIYFQKLKHSNYSYFYENSFRTMLYVRWLEEPRSQSERL